MDSTARRQEPRLWTSPSASARPSWTTTTGCAAIGGSSRRGRSLSFEDNVNSIKRRLWLETDRAYRAAAERLIRIKTNTQVKVAEADDSDDFSTEAPSNFVQVRRKLKFTEAQWQEQDPQVLGPLPELPERADLARHRARARRTRATW